MGDRDEMRWLAGWLAGWLWHWKMLCYDDLLPCRRQNADIVQFKLNRPLGLGLPSRGEELNCRSIIPSILDFGQFVRPSVRPSVCNSAQRAKSSSHS